MNLPTIPKFEVFNNQTIDYAKSISDISGEFLLIDSTNRNWNTEDSNNYIIETGQKYQDVVSIELVDAYIPATGYVITDTNNRLLLSENDDEDGGQCINVYIKEGYYTIDSLSSQIGSQLTTSSINHYTYTVSSDPISKMVTISSNGPEFSLIFEDGYEIIGDNGLTEELVINNKTHRKEIRKIQSGQRRNKYLCNSIGPTLGFRAINLKGQNSYTGQLIYNLSPFEYIAIFINTENSENFKNIQTLGPNDGADGAFAVAKQNVLTNTNIFSIINFTNREQFTKFFNPPIQFSKIKVQFKTLTGKFYNFYGLENYLVLEVKQLFGKRIVNTISQLGVGSLHN
jgi:hypothetical protein